MRQGQDKRGRRGPPRPAAGGPHQSAVPASKRGWSVIERHERLGYMRPNDLLVLVWVDVWRQFVNRRDSKHRLLWNLLMFGLIDRLHLGRLRLGLLLCGYRDLEVGVM